MKANLPFKYIITVKNGKQYVVFDYRDGDGKRKRKWITIGLPEKCAKKALNDKVEEIVAEFYENYLKGNVTKINKPATNIPQVNVSANAEDLSNMLFGDYIYYWYNTAKSTFLYTYAIRHTIRLMIRLISRIIAKYTPIRRLLKLLHKHAHYTPLYTP